MASDLIRIEVAYAAPGAQFLRSLSMNPDSTIAEAIVESGVEIECGIRSDALTVGIWSKPASMHTILRDGDRVELYRALKVDPKEGRRLRAKSSVR